MDRLRIPVLELYRVLCGTLNTIRASESSSLFLILTIAHACADLRSNLRVPSAEEFYFSLLYISRLFAPVFCIHFYRMQVHWLKLKTAMWKRRFDIMILDKLIRANLIHEVGRWRLTLLFNHRVFVNDISKVRRYSCDMFVRLIITNAFGAGSGRVTCHKLLQNRGSLDLHSTSRLSDLRILSTMYKTRRYVNGDSIVPAYSRRKVEVVNMDL